MSSEIRHSNPPFVRYPCIILGNSRIMEGRESGTLCLDSTSMMRYAGQRVYV